MAIVLSVLLRFTTSGYPFGILWPLYCLSFLDLRLLITLLVSCGHCIVCPSSIYDFWLSLLYLVAIVLSFPPRFTTSDYPFGILWPLYCLSFLDLRLLITPLVSCGHCIVCPSSIYDFWLPLWYHVAIVLSVLPRFTTFDYPFGILWPLYCLSVLDLWLLIIPFVSCGHCIVFPSSIYDFWLPLWYLVAVVLSVLPRFTTSDYPFGILWPLYCLSLLDFVLSVIPRFTTSDYPFGILWPLCCLSFLDLRLLITTLVSCGHFIVCPSSSYDFWLPFWYLVAIALSVLPRSTTSDYPFDFLWPLYCLSFLDLRLMITHLVSSGHCIVCPSSIYDFWLPLWYLVAIVLSVLPRFTTFDYPFGILWPLYCLSFLDLRLLITPLVSCGHCIVCPSSIYDFWLPLWYHVAIVLSVLPRFTIFDYPLVSCGLYTVFPSSIYDFWLPLWYLVAIVLSVLPRFTTSDYFFGILWPLHCLSFLDLRLLITPVVSCSHRIVCPSSIYDFWLPLWYLVAIALSVILRFCIFCHSSIYDLWLPFSYLVAIVLSVLPRFTTSDYPFGILWPLHCLSLLDFVLSVLPRFTTYDYPFRILWPLYCLSFLDLRLLITPLVSCGHFIVCPSSIYDFWLPLWFLVAIVLSVVPGFTTYDYPFGILWPLYCLSFDLRLLVTALVSCGHCIVCPSSIYDFWLPFWYPVAIVLSVLPRFTTSDNTFGIMWPLYCLSFLDLRLCITLLVSCGHCIVCPSSINDFWLPLWYLVAIAFSVLPRFTTSDYPFGILWPLYCLSLLDFVLSVIPRFTTFDYPFGILWPLCCLSFLDLRLMIILFVSCGHCIVCPSSIYDFWLLLWYLVAILLSVLPRSTTSDYPFGFLWPLYCLSFLDLRLMITHLVSCGHCIVCPSIYDFWLPLWYLVAIVLSVLPRFTTFDYPFGILWPLYCLSFLDLRLLITPLASCGHCIVCPSSIYDFGLPLWYHVAIVLPVLPRFTTFDYPFGILWPLYCLSVLDLRLLIIPFVSCGHCIVFPSSIYDFWLPLWYLVAVVLSVLPRFTTSDYPFGIMWPLYCLSFLDLRLLITPLVSCGHCIVCPSSIYHFWLPLWCLVAFILSFPPRFTTSDYPFGILWPLYCLSYLDLRLLITSLVSCGHCIVCPSSIYDFCLPLWYLVAIALSVLPRFTTSDYSCGILWPLYCLSFDLRLLVTALVSCGHCIVCPSSIYDFWLPFWYPVAIVLSLLPRFTTSDYPFGIMWPLYCLSFLDLRLFITLLVSCGHCIVCPSSINDFWLPLWYLVAIAFSVLPRFTTSDYPFGILWPLYCLSLLDFVLCVIPRFTTFDYPFGILWPLCCLSFVDLRLMIILFVSCGHCIVCPSSIYDFWLLLWYLVAILLSVVLGFTTYDYPFGILWPLYCLSFFDLRLLVTPLVSCGHCIVCPSSIYDFWLPFWYPVAIVLSVLPRFTTSDYPFGIMWPLYCLSFLDLRLLITPLVSCGHCIVCPSSIYDFWLPFWYLVAIVLSVRPRFTTSDYPFCILWPLYCLSLLDLRLLITPLVSCGRCIVCPFSINDFWLPLWYLVAIVFSVLPRFTTSDYPFGILWPLYCLSHLDFVLSVIPRFTTLITPLVSCGHCVVCPSSIYDLWLSFSYLLAIVLSILPRFTTSDYSFGILWPFYCLSFLELRLLITLLVSCGHSIVCPSSIYDFWLPLRFLVAIVLSVVPGFTTYDYPFGILWPLYCLSFFDLRLLVTPLVSCGHCIVCPSSIYDFWLPFWYLVAIVLSVRTRFTTSDYPFCILWPLYCLSLLDLRLLITPLVSCGHCIVCPSSIYDFWLPLWYHVAIVLSVLPRFTTFDYPFGILLPLYCLSVLDLRLLIIPFVSCVHCIVFPSSIYDFWLLLWYLVAVVLSVLPRLTTSDCPFGILWPLCFLSFLDLRLLITPLVSCGHCIVCHSSILYCPSFLDLRLLITPLVSCGHCVVCPSSIYDFWLLLWYLVAILLSVLPRVTTSDYPFGILWPLHCLSFLDLRLLITPLISCGHCIVCRSWIYDLWLPIWYLLAIVLSVLLRFTTSGYPFGILWPLYCLSFLDLRLLITLLVSCGHCIVCPSSI